MYSVNQVKHLYVLGEAIVYPEDGANTPLDKDRNSPGDLALMTSPDGNYIYFNYLNIHRDIMATDRIKKGKVKWVTVTPYSSMQKPLRKWTIRLDSNVNGGDPVVGQDYIIEFSFKNYFGASDEHTYEKYASARAFSTSASDLYRDLALSLAKNLSREVDKPFSVSLNYTNNMVVVQETVEAATKKDSLVNTYTGITLVELEQPWELGRMKVNRPDISDKTIHFIPVEISGVEYYNWGNVTEETSGNYIGNGKETADLEWFCMGERGDQYRGKDWPLSITTPANLMVDPSKEYNYLIVHFWDDIDNEGPQKSERDLIFVGDEDLKLDFPELAVAICQACGLDSYIEDGSAVAVTSSDEEEGEG